MLLQSCQCFCIRYYNSLCFTIYENRIEYTGKSIENEYSHPTKNVKNESDDCINERKLSPGEKDKKCK